MADRDKVIKLLESIYRLEVELKVLQKSYRKLRNETEYERELDMRNIPDACRVGGKTNVISKPTENKAIACVSYSKEAEEIREKIDIIKSRIKAIKSAVEAVYNNRKFEMKPEGYNALTNFYFLHMSIFEIMSDTNYSKTAVNNHKNDALDVLAKHLPKSIYQDVLM